MTVRGSRRRRRPATGCPTLIGPEHDAPPPPARKLTGNVLERFAELSPDLFCLAGFDGYFKYLSPSWERLLGYSIEELCERPYIDLVHPDDRLQTSREADAMMAKGKISAAFRNRYIARDGSHRWLEWNAEIVKAEELIYAVARDVTDLTLLEVRRAQVQTLVVHDLKNPLAAILANADYLTACPDLDEVAQLGREILIAGEQMQRLLLNLLDVSRLEEGALLEQLSDVDVGALMNLAATQMRRRAASESKRITVTGPPCSLFADAQILRRVLDNLLDNALKYTDPGGTIVLEAERVEDAIEIRISDDGPGIPVEQRERVFEKYVRLEDLHRSPAARTSRGLGLVFCRMAVEAHGGQIWITENAPRGTKFCVRLPLRRPTRPPP